MYVSMYCKVDYNLEFGHLSVYIFGLCGSFGLLVMFIVVKIYFRDFETYFLRDIYWTSPLYQILIKIQSELFL